MPYAGDPQWAHAAGHIGVKPNYGDNVVPCAPGCGLQLLARRQRRLVRRRRPRQVRGQRRHLGVDAAQLLGARHSTSASAAADFADGTMNIPENKNKVPDLLDEARWELEFLLKMQVPDGREAGGHGPPQDPRREVDRARRLAPHEDPMPRFLHPPSTAATLNLAANAAQAARIWKTIDKAFSDKCLTAAERAWAAAKANPGVIRAERRRRRRPVRRQERRRRVLLGGGRALHHDQASPSTRTSSPSRSTSRRSTADWNDNPGMHTSMTWGDTQALGSISLAIVPNGLGKDVVDGDPQEHRRRRPTATWS